MRRLSRRAVVRARARALGAPVREHQPPVTGTSLFFLPGVGAVAQLAYGRRTAWVGAATGAVALALGVGLIVLSAAEDSAAALIVGLVVGGAGFGLAFLGSLRALSAQIPPTHRAGVMSAFFIAAYAALSIPAVLAGFAVLIGPGFHY